MIPTRPVFLDSPMAIHATAIYRRTPEHDAAFGEGRRGRRPPFAPPIPALANAGGFQGLNASRAGVIVSASGMATGGRVVHHLGHLLPDPHTTVLFVGYQAAGTRGRLLRDSTRTLRVFGEDVPVRGDHPVLRRLLGARRSGRDPALAARVQAPARA